MNKQAEQNKKMIAKAVTDDQQWYEKKVMPEIYREEDWIE